jgi:hypothetical protein|tara:strand:+ start:161 stop:1741 length:1581 start_codon:yes stop_codon:yes gene_type:complete
MKIISQYILSNNYTVAIQTNGIQNQAVLRDSVGFSIQIGPKNFGATETQLVNQIITDYQPKGLKNDNNNWSVTPTIVEKVGAEPEIPPIIKLYTVEGRIANKNTQEPIQGIKVYISSSLPETEKNYGGYAIDPNSTATYEQGYETKSDVDGIWELTFKIQTEEVTPDVFSVLKTPDIIFESEDMLFGEEKRKPYAGDNDIKTVKSSLDIIQMKPFIPDLKKQTTKLKNIAGDEIDKLKNLIPKDPMQALQKAVGKKIQDIIRKFIPLIIGMIAKFGISKLTEALRNGFKKFDKKNCPSPEELKKLIRKRNKIVRILNAIYKFVDALVKAAGLVLTLIQLFKLVKSIVVNLPIPQATGLPPAKDGGGLAFSQPMSATLKNSDAIGKFEQIIQKYEFLTIMVLAILTVLRAVLKMAIDLLKGLDGMIETCANEFLKNEEITLEEINADLLESLVEEEEVQLDPFLNGFELSVVPIPNTGTGSVNRRQAIAKNKDNVILLRGEPSFSASDQILIDELKFYITQNNLKAN